MVEIHEELEYLLEGFYTAILQLRLIWVHGRHCIILRVADQIISCLEFVHFYSDSPHHTTTISYLHAKVTLTPILLIPYRFQCVNVVII
jgi:hypothetical protein